MRCGKAFLASCIAVTVFATCSGFRIDSFPQYGTKGPGIQAVTPDSCTGPEPFPDPDSVHYFYQCYKLFDGSWLLIHYICGDNVFEPISGRCIPAPTEASTTTDSMTTTEVLTTTTEPMTTTEILSTTVALTSTEAITTVSTEKTTTLETATTMMTEMSTTFETSTENVPSTTALHSSTEVATTVDTTLTKQAETTYVSSVTTQASSTTTELPHTSTVPSTTELSSTPTEFLTTTAIARTTPGRYVCVTDGVFPDPLDPSKYYRCINVAGQMYHYVYTCPANLCFDKNKSLCVAGSCPVTTTMSTTSLAPVTTSLSPVPENAPCTQAGAFPDVSDCTRYIECVLVGSTWYQYRYACPATSFFDKIAKKCVIGNCANVS